MLEINSLYRIIGRCEGEIQRLNGAAAPSTVSPGGAPTASVKPGDPAAGDDRIYGMSKQMISLYGAIGVGVLILIAKVIGSFRKTTDE